MHLPRHTCNAAPVRDRHFRTRLVIDRLRTARCVADRSRSYVWRICGPLELAREIAHRNQNAQPECNMGAPACREGQGPPALHFSPRDNPKGLRGAEQKPLATQIMACLSLSLWKAQPLTVQARQSADHLELTSSNRDIYYCGDRRRLARVK